MPQIIESREFRRAVNALGGHRVIDPALEPIIEALYHNPHGFPLHSNEWMNFRYARTKALPTTPALVVIFTIEPNDDVILQHVEEDLDA